MGKGGAIAAVMALLLTALVMGATGCGSSGEDEAQGNESVALQTAEEAAIDKYRWYLERKTRLLAEWTEQLWGQIVVGDAGKAGSRYATSRVQYGHLLPAPHLIPALDLRINGQRSEQEGEFTGFHRIERGVLDRESTAGLKPVAKTLVEDIQKLHYELKNIPLDPVELTQASRALLKEVTDKKLAGEEEQFSGLDLVDASASLEGAEAAFQVVRPRLTAADPDFVLEIEAQFAAAYEPLAELGSPARQFQLRDPAAGAIFADFDELSSAEKEELKGPIRQLASSFAEIPERLSGSQ